MQVLVRRSSVTDMVKMTEIFDEARGTIASLGIDQWQNGYPHADVIKNDIDKGYSRVVELDGEVCATFAVIDDGEPTHDKIYDGEWLTGADGNYVAIHRVAILVNARGKGIAKRIVDYACFTARKLDRASVRIDTHRGNVVMRKMLEKNGFTHCGTIYLESGDERVAYERLI